MNFHYLLEQLNSWVTLQGDIDDLAIAGSYARGEQQADSDVDICIFTSLAEKYLADTRWISYFGEAVQINIERWGVVDTVRVFLSDGTELEFNFCGLSWADIPVDAGTYRVVSDGIKILYDPSGKLLKLQNHVCAGKHVRAGKKEECSLQEQSN